MGLLSVSKSVVLLVMAPALLTIANRVHCKSVSELVKRLTADYPGRLRPVRNCSDGVVISHRMTPRQIIEMDEKNQIIVLKAWLSEKWIDEYMTWEPADYGNVKDIRIQADKIWLPDVVLVNSASQVYQQQIIPDVIITHKGLVTRMAPMLFRATCPIDPAYFPFDDQICNMTFMSWSYHGGLLDLAIDQNTNIDSFKSNSEWELTGLQVVKEWMYPPCCPEHYPLIIYKLHLERRSTFYVFNIVFPSFLACILVAVGFILPSDSGERVTLCITSVLVEFVFLETTSDYMPPNAENLPIIQLYLLSTIGIVVFSVLMTAVSLRFHFKGPLCKPVPPWLHQIIFKFIAPLVCVQTEFPRRRPEGTQHQQTQPLRRKNAVRAVKFRMVGPRIPKFQNNPSRLIWLVGDSAYDQDTADKLEAGELTDSQQWQEMAKIIDRFYFVIYLLTVAILIIKFVVTIIVEGGRERHGFLNSTDSLDIRRS
ncbi:neuronal acetylcholine receptor subunit alpha-10-like [Ptychodera flava]|uniref:neuronal acetylcholine receptor subunit alpha-10-like n=1 Tax=Ptychodera flava TaxID=63121 RepID=UPI00396A5AE9